MKTKTGVWPPSLTSSRPGCAEAVPTEAGEAPMGPGSACASDTPHSPKCGDQVRRLRSPAVAQRGAVPERDSDGRTGAAGDTHSQGSCASGGRRALQGEGRVGHAVTPRPQEGRQSESQRSPGPHTRPFPGQTQLPTGNCGNGSEGGRSDLTQKFQGPEATRGVKGMAPNCWPEQLPRPRGRSPATAGHSLALPRAGPNPNALAPHRLGLRSPSPMPSC